MRDSEKVTQLVLEALHLLQDADAFECVSPSDQKLLDASLKTVEALYESLPSLPVADPNKNKYNCQPYGVEKCDDCFYPFDDCRCD